MRSLKTLLSRAETPDDAVAEPRQNEQCLSCGADLEGSRSYERFRVCHACGFHFHLTARERIATLLDVGSFHEDDRGVTSIDPLSFRDRQSYRSRVINAQRRTGLTESALTGTGTIYGRDIVMAVPRSTGVSVSARNKRRSCVGRIRTPTSFVSAGTAEAKPSHSSSLKRCLA